MTTGGFVRLIFLKDVRRFMWLLGAVFGLGLTDTLVLREGGTTAILFVILHALAACLTGLLITIELIQIDRPGRDLRFISTRPVPGEAIFFAKIFFLGLVLIIGGWGFQELDYASLGMPLGPLDHLCLLIETTIHLGTGPAFVTLFALFLRKNAHVVLALTFFFVSIFIIASVSVIVFPGISTAAARNQAQLHWGDLVFLFGQAGFIGVVLLAALVRYRTRAYGLPLALGIGGVILDLVICMGATAMGDSRLAHDQTGRMPLHLYDQIRLTKSFDFPAQTEQTAWNGGVTSHTVVRGLNIEGISPPYYFQVVGSQSTATLRSGQMIHSIVEQTSNPHTKEIGAIGVPFEAEVIGISSAIPGVSYAKSGMLMLRAFTYLPFRLPKEDLTGVSIKGEVQLEIHRAYVAGSIPVEAGSVFSQPRQHCEITAVSASQGGEVPNAVPFHDLAQLAARGIVSGAVQVGGNASGVILLNLTYTQVPLILRGDAGNNSDNLSWALVSRPRNEILQVFSGSGSHTSFPVDIAISSMLYSKPGGHAIPPDWLKGAELVFLGNKTCGQITVPYQINDVTLTR